MQCIAGTEAVQLLVVAVQTLADTVAVGVHAVLHVGTDAVESPAAHAADNSLRLTAHSPDITVAEVVHAVPVVVQAVRHVHAALIVS